jgi:cell division control protein 6
MGVSLIDDELNRPSVFKDESKLSVEYVPSTLPHREAIIKQLTQIFRSLILYPGKMSHRVLITGGVGSGKTAVTKLFGNSFVEFAQKRGITVHYIHINCRRDKTEFMVLKRIVKHFSQSIPERGFSPEELLQMLVDILDQRDIFLILTLDEIDYLITKSGTELIYDLTRLTDEQLNATQRLSLIGITRDAAFRQGLDRSTVSTLQHNTIQLMPYTVDDLQDIVSQRAEEALYQGCITDDTISLISDISATANGDARYAIELLWRSGKTADDENLFKISPEHVRNAKADTHPVVRREILNDLTRPQLLLLLALARTLKRSDLAYSTMGEVEEAYHIASEEYQQSPRSHTQIWEYVQDLQHHGIIQTKLSGAKMRGKTTLFSLPDVSARVLEEHLTQILTITRQRKQGGKRKRAKR